MQYRGQEARLSGQNTWVQKPIQLKSLWGICPQKGRAGGVFVGCGNALEHWGGSYMSA